MRALVILPVLAVILLESARYLVVTPNLAFPKLGRAVYAKWGDWLERYELFRSFAIHHPYLTLAGVLTLFCLGALGVAKARKRLSRKHIERTTGMTDDLEALSFPSKRFDLLAEIDRRPKGHTFVGLSPVKRRLLPGYRWKPVYLSNQERSMHRHVVGKTGSGKTSSILWPQVLQDALDGKGALVMDAKGSDENARMMRGIAKVAGRTKDLRHFNLAAWSTPNLFSNRYNMLHVAPRTPQDPNGGNVVAMSERVFNVLGLGDEPYYRSQAQLAFTRLCRLLHGIVGSSGHGYPFTMVDLGICLRGLITGAPDSPYGRALKWCIKNSVDRGPAEELDAALKSKGAKLEEDLAGLVAAVDRFQAPIVNAYAPELIFEEAMEKNLLLYVQLPSNLHRIQAPALGRVMLADVQQGAAFRQVFRAKRNQTPFSVNVDEFGTFADLGVIDSLNKTRDANVQFTLLHQSFADLDLVDEKFTRAVWDNTRTKDLLAEDDPELCERYARSLGTRPHLEHTMQQVGHLNPTGAMSTRAVEKYILHPNAFKALAASGQGYLFVSRKHGREAVPVVYGQMPELYADYDLPLNDQSKARGLRLHEKFVEAGSARLDATAEPAPSKAPRPQQAAPRAERQAGAEPGERTNSVMQRTNVPGVRVIKHYTGSATRSLMLPPPPAQREEGDDADREAGCPANDDEVSHG